MIEYKNYYLKESEKKTFFNWCLDNQLHKRNTPNFSSRMQLVFTGFVETQSVTAIVAYEKTEVVGILLCENKMCFHNGKIYDDPSKYIPQEQERFDWGFYNLGILNIFVKPKFRNQGIAKKMVEDIEKIRLNKLATIENHWVEESKPVFEAQELSFEIASKNFKNSYVSTGRPEDKYNYRQVIHGLTVKCKDKTGCKQYDRNSYKEIDLQIEKEFVVPVKAFKQKKKQYT